MSTGANQPNGHLDPNCKKNIETIEVAMSTIYRWLNHWSLHAKGNQRVQAAVCRGNQSRSTSTVLRGANISRLSAVLVWWPKHLILFYIFLPWLHQQTWRSWRIMNTWWRHRFRKILGWPSYFWWCVLYHSCFDVFCTTNEGCSQHLCEKILQANICMFSLPVLYGLHIHSSCTMVFKHGNVLAA